MGNLGNWSLLSLIKDNGTYGIACAAIVAIVIPILLSVVIGGRRKLKQRAVPVEVGGEAGYAMRNVRSVKLVEVPWEGATTMAALFEQACRKYSQQKLLGSRKIIAKDTVTSSDGRKFEKLHLGEYQWESYQQIYGRVCNFASGMIKIGHDVDTRAAIFSDTRPEWLIAFHVRINFCEFFNLFCCSYLVFPYDFTIPLSLGHRDASGRTSLSSPFMLL